MRLKAINPFFWGFSIALSWTWGLGLFFSVQVAIQFGLAGLLGFAIPNALGLIAFGWFTQHIAKKAASSLEFEKHFLATVGNLRWVFLFYQVVAIALTFFALFKYVFFPLGISLPMIGLLVLGASLLLGEQFNIGKLKWSHLGMSAVILLSVLLIGWGGGSYFHAANVLPRQYEGVQSVISFSYLGYFVPIVVGFLLGPWLDIQQWQRAIQIRREHTNIGISYTVGGIIFFGILLFHGTLALAIWGEGLRLGIPLAQISPDGLFHAKDAIVRFLFLSGVDTPVLFRVMYVTFLCLCIVATLDSGYVALRWFQADAVKKSDHILMALIPNSLLNSPLPPFLLAAAVAFIAIPLGFELEYFMALYGSFLVGYAMVFLFRTTFKPRFTAFTQTTLLSLAALSIGIFGLGYFESLPLLMIVGSLIPLTHAIVTIMSRKAVEEIKRSGVMDRIAEGEIGKAVSNRFRPKEGPQSERETAERDAQAREMEPAPDLSPHVSSISKGASSWIEGKWFVHSLTATYQDTNSVGNVYFAQYGMWVGKTRELFFAHALPDFDLKTSPWYILTRAFEHKFLKETKEFEQIEVWVRIQSVNRKFVTMEHQIFDSARTLLGKGKQVLLFVSSKDYHIIDVPGELHTAFLPYL
ncbi:acyl-CoA thioesterase [bacterium]|nr:acyl-CoA thioesterase [bacterium]